MHGRLVTISPAREGALAFFAFRSPELTDLDLRDSEQHRRVVAGAFANGSWRVPELLERVREADDIYFDSVSQVTLDRWSSGRVALVGDAASSVSLFGGGSSLAISSAFTLAKQLAREPENHERAFGRYEAVHRKRVEPKQRNVKLAASRAMRHAASRRRAERLQRACTGLNRRPPELSICADNQRAISRRPLRQIRRLRARHGQSDRSGVHVTGQVPCRHQRRGRSAVRLVQER